MVIMAAPAPTVGHQLLQERISGAPRDAARVLGVSSGFVYGWLRGQTVPQAQRQAMWEAYGIPLESWHTKLDQKATVDAFATDTDVSVCEAAISECDEVASHMSELMTDGELNARERIQAANVRIRAMQIKAGIEQRALDAEQAFFRSARWRDLRDTIFLALEPWPDALKAVQSSLAGG